MSRVLLIFAQLSEAKQTIERLKATAVETEKMQVWSEGEIPSLYQFNQGSIVISNVGIHSAQMAVAKYAQTSDEVWNLGLAGSLRSDLPLGEIISIKTVSKYLPIEKQTLDLTSQECIAQTIPLFHLDKKGSRLISSDFPIHQQTYREHLKIQGDLVDMEGYGVAYAAHQLGKKCRMWKIISDFASPGGRELIRKHKAKFSAMIADQIIEELHAKDHESSSYP